MTIFQCKSSQHDLNFFWPCSRALNENHVWHSTLHPRRLRILNGLKLLVKDAHALLQGSMTHHRAKCIYNDA